MSHYGIVKSSVWAATKTQVLRSVKFFQVAARCCRALRELCSNYLYLFGSVFRVDATKRSKHGNIR